MMNETIILSNKFAQIKNLIEYWYVTNIKRQGLYDYIGYKQLDEEGLYSVIETALESSMPLCIGKIGGSESFALESMTFSKKKKIAYDQLCRCAGFFPNTYSEEAFRNYCNEQTMAISQVDIIINYPKRHEMYFLRKLIDHKIFWCRRITPWLLDKQWMSLLSGKNVLVIHPYAELIEKQYEKRELLFQDTDMLPEFNLYTIKAVQTIGNRTDERFSTWVEALQYMENEARKIDFDVALIGCGAYGLPLAARIKKMGKIGIHCGGELQTYFGIRGKRWDDNFPDIMEAVANKNWVRPEMIGEKGQLEQVEDGCYL